MTTILEDGTSHSGSVNTVVRIGNTVHRPLHRWTPAVHALLRHLERANFPGTPRVLGVDEQGREVLTFIEGQVATRPWPEVLHHTDGLVQLARFLACYHEAIRDFVPPVDVEWYVPGVKWRSGYIIRHGDLGPWNTVWRGAELIGIIDWDFAEPGVPMTDLAQLAWQVIPLRGGDLWRKAGFTNAPDLRGRLHILCEAYGADPACVLDALLDFQVDEAHRIEAFGRQGLDPWITFYARGDVKKIVDESAWLRREYSRLIG